MFKDYLSSCFCIKDLGPLKYFLGLEVARGPLGLFVSQHKYTLEIVEECGLLGRKLVDLPIKENHKLALTTGTNLGDMILVIIDAWLDVSYVSLLPNLN